MGAYDLDLEGKRVLVTGASCGIGAAAARAFASVGAQLVLHYHEHDEEMAQVRHETGARAVFKADFRSMNDVRRVVIDAMDELAGLDVLVNNVGHMLARVDLEEMEDADIDAVFDLNARSVVVACREALPELARSRGTIVNVSSISARTGGSPGSSLYSASKAFVSTFTRSLARELAPKGVRVNAVSPGTIHTRFHEAYSTPEKLEATAKRIPLGRLGTAEDCVGAFLFLTSPRMSGYVTGQVVEVNGGQLMP
jgi:3-oxoacyl-[acyl-carrier protein] reductase